MGTIFEKLPDIELPPIGNMLSPMNGMKGVPFKGFLDMSIVSQKMRKINNSELKIDKGAFKKRHQSVTAAKSRNMSPNIENSLEP